ncbi:hypothetical protein [Nocardia gipuzkoensis]|uniref:hypothetical protein n=1 Tax=Nocardia gipuzkoensis TaxID=2749991 RepID=UPI0015EEB160|nr:hypothetical protein [Nocardia gipuzkoensis]
MKRVEIFERPSRSEMRNPEALKKRIPATNGGRDDAYDAYRLACMMAATDAEENGGDDQTCLSHFEGALPGWLSRLGLNLDVHVYGICHVEDDNSADRGDASSIYWTMSGFSDRPRVYEAIAFPAGTPEPSGSLREQYDGWAQSAAALADRESSDAARFSAFVAAMSSSLNSSGKDFPGTSFGYYNTDGGEMYTPSLEATRMLWSLAPMYSLDGHIYECITALPK